MITYTFFNETYTEFLQEGIGAKKVELQNGFLIVEAVTADGIPLPRTSVMVYRTENGKEVTERVVRTGIDGRTQRIALAVPAKKFSMLDTNVQVPYKSFSIRLETEGYYTETYADAQIYADTTITFMSKLTPLPLGVSIARAPARAALTGTGQPG